MKPDSITYHFSFDRDDLAAPAGVSVEDHFRGVADPSPWRVTRVEVTRFPNGEEPIVRIEGMPVAKSGKADRRKTYTVSMCVSPEIEAAFVEAAQ